MGQTLDGTAVGIGVPRVVIIGAGFGGLRAARALANAPVNVMLLDRTNYHLFQPLLYQVATAGLSPDEIAYPVRAIFRKQKNLEFRMTEVQQVDLAGRRLLTNTGEIPYDTLILAAGGETNYFGLDSVARNSFGLKSLADATRLRNHILRMFELAAQESSPEKCLAMRTFVIAGGGPTGVECAGAISELIRLVLAKDYPRLNFDDVRVILLEGTGRLLPGMPDRLANATVEKLKQKHVEVRFGAQVTGFDGTQVTLKVQDAGGAVPDSRNETLPACTLIWAAGVRAVQLVDSLGVKQGSQGRVLVNSCLQIPEHPEVFVIGDAAFLSTNGDGSKPVPLPMVAPVAMQQAAVAAENIQRHLAGKPLKDFVYKDPGSLATIGRNAAVARLGRWEFKGFIAWVLWLVVHILQLIGFRNRLVVMINWVWDYLFYDRAVRLIE